MYLVVVALTMFALPILSVAIELEAHPAPVMLLVGKWFVFWAVGVRLVMAGLRQLFQPEFTAREIFHMEGDEAMTLVRELGVSNFAVGVVGLAAVAVPMFVLPSAITAGCLLWGRRRQARGRDRAVAEPDGRHAERSLRVCRTGDVHGGAGRAPRVSDGPIQRATGLSAA